MESNNKPSGINRFIRKYVLKNLSTKIIALVFAMIMWGVVLATQNPSRLKTIQDVPVSFEGSADLHARNLVVRGHPLQDAGGVSVRVNTPITNYKDLTADYLSATINLRSVTAAGTWALPVNATTTAPFNTQDIWVSTSDPAKIEVEIDTLIKKTLPVEARYEGTLPEGYWADEAELSVDSTARSTVEISGPKQDVERVTKAICYIQLDGRTESYNDAVTMLLWDKDGNEIDPSLFLDELPSVTVKMAVHARKTVSVDVMGSLLGADNLPPNYEIFSATTTPQEFSIVGNEDVLANITALTFESIDISGKKEPVNEKRALIVPEGVRILGTVSEVDVFVDIREKVIRKEFQALPILPRDLDRGLVAEFSKEIVDIVVDGRISLVELLERNDISVYVDLKGLREGTYQGQNVNVYLGDDDTTVELLVNISVGEVTVVISRE